MKSTAATLPSTNSNAQMWLSDPFEALLKKNHLTLSFHEKLFETPSITSEKKEIGYLWVSENISACKPKKNATLPIKYPTKYAVNLDGKQLIYFDYSLWSELPYDNRYAAKQISDEIGNFYVTHKEIDKFKNISYCIMNNIMINYKNVIEANHISINNNNHIILERKT